MSHFEFFGVILRLLNFKTFFRYIYEPGRHLIGLGFVIFPILFGLEFASGTVMLYLSGIVSIPIAFILILAQYNFTPVQKGKYQIVL